MNLVLLCKRHNHRKVLEILAALRAQHLTVRGIVALERREARPSFSEIVRKLYYRRQERNAQQMPASLPSFAANGRLHLANPYTDDVPVVKSPRPSLQSNQTYTSVDEYVRAHSIPLVAVPDLNGAECVAALQKFQTDLVLLGGTPIIRANVLAVPKVGTLNVHMAWLPGIRGMNVAEWSVYCNAPVAVTVHFVDAGVDTGAVLYREKIDVSACRSIAEMRQKLSTQQHLALAHATRLFIDRQIQPAAQTQASGKQYYIMHERLRHIVEKKLQEGLHA
ncbi:hypothetical protein HUU05_01675 [candidate division KSB1 bacterium]|nr:hypothetical protein [candidate division KSB1 bacterium]